MDKKYSKSFLNKGKSKPWQLVVVEEDVRQEVMSYVY